MSNRVFVRLAAAFMLLMALIGLGLTWRAIMLGYGPLPFWDQWERVTPGQHISRIFQPHNEHRIILPTLFFILDSGVFAGRNLFLLISIQIIQAAHLALLIAFARRAGVTGPHLTLAGALGAILLFSGAQIENFYWGFQVQFVLVFLLASAGIATAVLAPSRLRYDLAAGALTLGAAISLSAGLLAAPVALAAALLAGAGLRRLAVLGGVLVLAGIGYAIGYESNPGHSDPIESLKHPVDVLYYVVVYLGAPFGDAIADGPLARAWPALADPVNASKWVGAMGLGAWLAFAPLILLTTGPRARIVLLAIAGFVLAAAGLTALGRWELGAQQAMASRYATPVLNFWTCLYFLFGSLCVTGRFRFRRAASLAWMLAGLAAAVMLLGNWRGWTDMAEAQGERLQLAETAVLVGVGDPAVLAGVYPAPARVIEQRSALSSQRLSIFGRKEYDWLGQAVENLDFAASTDCLGAFDVREAAGGEPVGLRVFGWAWDQAAARPVETLLIADSTGRIVGLAYGGRPRPDVLQASPDVDRLETGWFGHAGPAAGALTAYAVIGQGAETRLCRIGAL